MSGFKELNKRSANSFQQQRQVIKQVLAGKTKLCESCKQPLFVVLPNQEKTPGVYCGKGCTAIELEIS
ncbi:hypothetical protein ACVFI8_15925 [Agarivorans sp. MS3-6]|uniref:hypothetical protein n=1 Tax=Agarivorans sp. TSD2052 TaxID=2937286 RepID=UPI00200F652F|nr:hypothetical protein [Agarivorans sp. TSD2052]UPW17651.1 hypothetical protein M0C34_15585 [Agarivorans sp. TSD2052]